MTAHATFNGQAIAESDHTIVVEGNHYFPADDVRGDLLRATSSRTLCPWKGIANYWTVEVDGERARNAAWAYRRPWPLARRVKGRIAFCNGVAVVAAAPLSVPVPSHGPTTSSSFRRSATPRPRRAQRPVVPSAVGETGHRTGGRSRSTGLRSMLALSQGARRSSLGCEDAYGPGRPPRA